MHLTPHIVMRGKWFHFVQRIPTDLLPLFPKPTIWKSLKAKWIDTEACIKAWRQRLQLLGKRTEWTIPLSITVSSSERISREEALKAIEKLVQGGQKKLPETLALVANYK